MRWHRLFLAGVVGFAGLGGCTDTPYTPSPPAPAAVRSQKAEPPKPPRRGTNLLDTLPEQPADAVSGDVAARIRATVNGYPILEEEVQANAYQAFMMIQQLPEPERSRKRREVYKEALEALIDRELLIQDAQSRLKKNGETVMRKLQDAAEKEFDRRWVKSMKGSNEGIKSDEDLKELLRRQGLSLEMIKRQWTRQFMATEYLRNRVMPPLDKIGHEQMQEYYEAHISEFLIDDSVEWQDVFISATNGKYKTRDEARKMAESIKAKLLAGEDFKPLCKQYDDGDSSLRDGAGNGRKRGEVQPADCEEHLFLMQPGEVGPIVEMSSGYHVFRLVTRVYAGRKPFDMDVQKDIRNKLRGEMYEREVKKIASDLRRFAVIEYAKGR